MKRYTDDEVIVALMSHETVRDAARSLGCSTRTVYNYVNADGFDVKLQAAIKTKATLLESMMDNALVQAIDCLTAIMTADSSGLIPDVTVEEQIRAAQIVLDYGARNSDVLRRAEQRAAGTFPQVNVV